MKKTHTPSEIAAAAAASKRGRLMGALAFLIGALMVWVTPQFVALHCVLMAGAALAGGRAAGRAAAMHDPKAVRRGGGMGGMLTGLGFGLPFALWNAYQWATLDDAAAARRLAALSQSELAQMRQFNIQPGLEYFIGQDASFIFGYLLAGLMLGWLVGVVGGLLGTGKT